MPLERTREIEHKGKKIVLLDYSNLTDEPQTLAAIEESRQYIRRGPPGAALLTCTDATGARYTAKVLESVKELAANNKPYVKAGATVSSSVVVRLVIAAVAVFSGRAFPTFATREEALDWLAAQ